LRWRLKEIELAKKIKINIIIGRRVFLAKKGEVEGGKPLSSYFFEVSFHNN